MSNVVRNDNSVAKSRRRHRQPRRRGDVSSSINTNNATTSGNSAKRSGSGANGPQEAKPDPGGAKKSSKSPKSTRPSKQSNNRGGRKNGQNRNNRRRHAQTKRTNNRRAHSSRAQNAAPTQTLIETSAGGLVVSGLAEAVGDSSKVNLSRIYVAPIGRHDRRGRLLWLMPKSHVKPGEAFDFIAEREVWEETGIRGEVIEEFGVIDYWFASNGTRVHKTVHHHFLRYVDGDLNDEDPEVTQVMWVPVDTLVERSAYVDERKLARRAYNPLPDLAHTEKRAGRQTPR